MADWRITWICYSKTTPRIIKFCSVILNISMCMCFSVLYLWYTMTDIRYRTFLCHGLDRYSLQHFRTSSWLISSSPPLQEELFLLRRPESIMPTQQPTQSAILSSSLAWPGRQVLLCREGGNNAGPWAKIAIWPCETRAGEQQLFGLVCGHNIRFSIQIFVFWGW